MKEEGKDEYCGLDCSSLLEQLDKVLKPAIEHAKYDPVFAPIMIDKLIARCMEAKALVIRATTKVA